jgi:serine/threonine protein phosphatase 1
MLDARKKYNLITLLGNHEEMMEESRLCPEAYYFWIMNGGEQTLESFNESSIDCIPDKYWKFINNCKLYYETDDHIFVHAGLEPLLPPAKQQSDILCWLRFRDLKPHISLKKIICGHTPQKANLPGILPHAICIDTYAFHNNGYLTCLDVNTGEYWQAKENGSIRKSRIESLQKQS